MIREFVDWLLSLPTTVLVALASMALSTTVAAVIATIVAATTMGLTVSRAALDGFVFGASMLAINMAGCFLGYIVGEWVRNR